MLCIRPDKPVFDDYCLNTFSFEYQQHMFWLRNKKVKYKIQGFSYLSEVGARGLLNLGQKYLNYQNWENFMQSKRTGLPF